MKLEAAYLKYQPIYRIPSLRTFQSSVHLDLLRGLAALEVFVGHCRTLFFVSVGEVTHLNLFTKGLYLLTSFGHQSVIIFFVLSGFLVSSSIFKAYRENRWSWRIYLVNRLSRLEVVLLPALILCFLLDTLGIYLFGEGGVYSGNGFGSNLIAFSVNDRLSFRIFLGNILFLQNISVPTFGSNSPLWSLTHEFWYYILFPLFFELISTQFTFNLKNCLRVGFGFLVMLGLGLSRSLAFLIWLMGSLINLLPLLPILSSRQVWRGAIVIFSSFLFGCIILTRFLARFELVSDFLIGIASSLLVYILLHDQISTDESTIYARFSRSLAGFSYTLYLVHLPLLVFLRAALPEQQRWQPDIFHVGIGIILCGVVLGYAFLISCLTEAKTDKVKHWLLMRFT
jgi:peptidoglycan/LPS O-acetylase OafA/YrhL